MRDKLKSLEYFAKYINQRESSTERFSKLILENINNPQANLSIGYGTIFSNSYHHLIAAYSSGASLNEIVILYNKVIESAAKSWSKVGGYYQMVWMLSLGILLRVEDETFNKLVQLVDRDKEDDFIINYLIAFRVKNRTLKYGLEFPDPYKYLSYVIEVRDKTKAPELMLQYLSKHWYQGHKDAYWYDNHKSKHDTYFGYWSFESAAVTAILGLDDSRYREQQYYPKDLVDYYRNTGKGNDNPPPALPERYSIILD
jgi:hypothetical protein